MLRHVSPARGIGTDQTAQTELTAHFAPQNPEFGNVGALGDWIDS